MSCTTLCLFVGGYGGWGPFASKYGPYHFASAKEAITTLLDGGLDDGSYHCRGIALDADARQYRYFHCIHDVDDVEQIEREALALAASPGWRGWDVAYAWRGLADLVDVVPGAAYLLAEEPAPTLGELRLADRDPGFVSWQPSRRELTYRRSFGPPKHDTLVTVIRPDGTVDDYDFDSAFHDDGALAILAHGEPLLDRLSAEPPYPPAVAPRRGAIIDIPSRRLHYWQAHAPAALLAAVERAWPGWQLSRLPFGDAGRRLATSSTAERPLRPVTAMLVDDVPS
jgi:hypothetical protein